MKTWFNITNGAAESDVSIYDEIGGWGITAEAFVKELKAITSPRINVHLNTPGGSVFEATAIYNSLKDHPARIIMHVDGLAASAGSFIAMAGDEIRIAANGYMMIHNAMGGAMGYAGDLRKTADLLDKLSGTIADTYAKRTGKPREEWMAAMADETWYSASEAVAAKLADSIKEDAAPQNKFDLRIYNKIPDSARVAWGISTNGPANATATKEPKPMTIEEFKAEAAKHPEAVASFIEQGKTEALNELSTPAKAGELKAAFPNDSGFVVDCLGADMTLEQAKAAYIPVLQAKMDTAIAAKDAEIAALKQQVAQAEFKAGEQGAVGTGAKAPEQPTAFENIADPKARAAAEWKADPSLANQFSSEAVYVGYRANELTGRVTISKGSKKAE